MQVSRVRRWSFRLGVFAILAAYPHAASAQLGACSTTFTVVPSALCVGGGNAGLPCAASTDCPGGVCPSEVLVGDSVLWTITLGPSDIVPPGTIMFSKVVFDLACFDDTLDCLTPDVPLPMTFEGGISTDCLSSTAGAFVTWSPEVVDNAVIFTASPEVSLTSDGVCNLSFLAKIADFSHDDTPNRIEVAAKVLTGGGSCSNGLEASGGGADAVTLTPTTTTTSTSTSTSTSSTSSTSTSSSTSSSSSSSTSSSSTSSSSTTSTSSTLPCPPNPLVGAAGAFGVLALGPDNTFSMSGPRTTIGSPALTRDVGIGPAATGQFDAGTVNGKIIVDPTGTLSKVNVANEGILRQDLAPAVSDALQASANAAALSPTHVFAFDVVQSVTLLGNGGLNVVDFSNKLTLSTAMLTLRGGPDDVFILNVFGQFKFDGGSVVVLEGGVLPNNVLFNIVGPGDAVKISGGLDGNGIPKTQLIGTVLAPDRTVSFTGSMITGALISGMDIHMDSGSRLVCPTSP